MAGKETFVYNSDEITCILAGINIESGKADGEFVKVEQNEDDFGLLVGTDGSGTRYNLNNRSAKITFRLMQTSPHNAELSALRRLDLANPNGAGVGALTIKNRQGDFLHTSDKCWIAAPPKPSFDKAPTVREWVLECTDLDRRDDS
jgi:hypothetical protein